MSFSAPKDYVGLADTNLILVASTQNATAQEATAPNERGDFIAREVFGETAAPQSEYRLKGNLNKAVTLGVVTGDDKVCLKSIEIKTAAGAEPQITATGETLQSTATASSTVSLGTLTCSVRHKAQILGGAFTLEGDGCSLTDCTYKAEANISRATIAGETLAHDMQGGTAVVTLTVVQTGATAPTITPAEGWDMTTPESVTSPDGDYETWTAALTKSLTSTEPA